MIKNICISGYKTPLTLTWLCNCVGREGVYMCTFVFVTMLDASKAFDRVNF